MSYTLSAQQQNELDQAKHFVLVTQDRIELATTLQRTASTHALTEIFFTLTVISC